MNSSKFFKVGVATMLLLASIVIGSVFNFGVANAATSKDGQGPVITVSGEAIIKVKPDIAYVNLGVQTQNVNAKVAQTENTTKMNNVMSALKQQGIKEEDIQTMQYSIYPNHRYNPNNGQSTIDGYIVQNSVRVVIRNIDSIGTVIDAVSNNDSNVINGIEFGVSDKSKYYLQALTKATENAKLKADTIAKAIDVKISKPSRIVEAGQAEPIVYSGRTIMDTKLESQTSISPGMLEIRASVVAEYNY